MLSRKGTWSRKTRASIRRHHGSHTHQNLNYPHQSPNYLLSGLNSNHPRQHLQLSSTARTYLSTAVSARRSSVPNLQCLDPPRSTLPCRSDTDIASRCNKRLAALPEEMVSNGETRGHLDASRSSAVIQNFEDGSHELKSPWSAGSFLSKKCDSHGNIQSLQGTVGLKDLQTTFNTTIASSRSYTGGTNNVDRDHTFGLSDAERATRSGADNSSTCLRDTPGWKSLTLQSTSKIATIFSNASRTSMLSRTATVVRKPRRRSGASRYGTRLAKDQHRKRRASAPILSPQQRTFMRIPSPISRSAETVSRLGPSPSLSLQASPSKSVSFSAEVEEVLTTRPDNLSLRQVINPTPPPSEKALYESTVVWAEAEDHDQAFSVLGSLCEAGLETGNACDFIFKAFFILSGTWPVTVFLVGLLALPLVMTTIGVNYLHECPVEPKLPIYLVVGGCFGILKLLFLLWKQIKRHKEDMGDLHDDEDLLTMTRMTNIALNIFLCVWFAFGHYWVFHIWKPQFHPPLHEPRNWCDETVFMFSFWQLIICHSVIALVLFLSAIMCCCFVCVKCVVVDTKR